VWLNIVLFILHEKTPIKALKEIRELENEKEKVKKKKVNEENVKEKEINQRKEGGEEEQKDSILSEFSSLRSLMNHISLERSTQTSTNHTSLLSSIENFEAQAAELDSLLGKFCYSGCEKKMFDVGKEKKGKEGGEDENGVGEFSNKSIGEGGKDGDCVGIGWSEDILTDNVVGEMVKSHSLSPFVAAKPFISFSKESLLLIGLPNSFTSPSFLSRVCLSLLETGEYELKKEAERKIVFKLFMNVRKRKKRWEGRKKIGDIYKRDGGGKESGDDYLNILYNRGIDKAGGKKDNKKTRYIINEYGAVIEVKMTIDEEKKKK
jgi:hypothetical protein